MTTKRNRHVPILMLAILALVSDSVAQDPAPREAGRGSLHLLDRGAAGEPRSSTRAAPGDSIATMMATLAVGSATPGVASGMVTVLGTPTMVAPPAFIGNFFLPPEFPPVWYPFSVTGVFAWQTMGPFGAGVNTLGAGVAPGPFPAGTAMWAAFGTAMSPHPSFGTGGVVGMPGNLAVALPVPMPPLGVACGLYADAVPGPGPGLGAIVPTAAPKDKQTFNGPPLGADFLLPPPMFGLFLHWVAGCYVTGATVPVELQSFHVG